jgi:hypothetical protein
MYIAAATPLHVNLRLSTVMPVPVHVLLIWNVRVLNAFAPFVLNVGIPANCSPQTTVDSVNVRGVADAEHEALKAVTEIVYVPSG